MAMHTPLVASRDNPIALRIPTCPQEAREALASPTPKEGQRLAIERYAKSAGFDVVAWFNDPAVSGADPIETRPGFAALLDRVEGNGVRTVIVEDASRFARDLVAQELGIIALIRRGVRVLTA